MEGKCFRDGNCYAFFPRHCSLRANATQCVFLLSGILDKFYFPQNILPKKIASGKEIQTQAGRGSHSLGFKQNDRVFRSVDLESGRCQFAIYFLPARCWCYACLSLLICQMRRITVLASLWLTDSFPVTNLPLTTPIECLIPSIKFFISGSSSWSSSNSLHLLQQFRCSTVGFPNLGTTDILGQIILCCEGPSCVLQGIEHCLWPLNARSICSAGVTSKNVFRYCQTSSEEQNWPQSRIALQVFQAHLIFP